MHHLWTPPALQELSLTAWHYGSVAAIYPACRCSPQAAGLDEIRGSAPNQSIEHERSLVHTGLADPGLTCPAITSSIALANRWGNREPRSAGRESRKRVLYPDHRLPPTSWFGRRDHLFVPVKRLEDRVPWRHEEVAPAQSGSLLPEGVPEFCHVTQLASG